MATNESVKDFRCVSICDEFVQCTLLSDSRALHWRRTDLVGDHIISSNIMYGPIILQRGSTLCDVV